MVTPDSGTSAGTMPSWALKKFHEAVGPDNQQCDVDAEFSKGELSFVIDGIEYPIPSHHWNTRVVNPGDLKGGYCSYTFAPLDIKQKGQQNLFILGD